MALRVLGPFKVIKETKCIKGIKDIEGTKCNKVIKGTAGTKGTTGTKCLPYICESNFHQPSLQWWVMTIWNNFFYQIDALLKGYKLTRKDIWFVHYCYDSWYNFD